MMSRILVFLQFLLIALIAYPFRQPAPAVAAIFLFSAGFVIFVMAVLAMKRSTFSVMPEPTAQGKLVVAGIYRLVRHPMYLAVLLCATGAALAYQQGWKWLACGCLTLVLIAKIRREERFLLQRYAGYAAYRSRVKAIIPFII